MKGVKFNPAKHRIHDLELVRHLRRETGRNDLFLYRHEGTGNWAVAVWLGTPGLQFMELMLMDHPGDMTREMVYTLKEWSHRKARTLRDWAKDQAEKERDETRKWDEDMKEAGRVKRWLGDRQHSQVLRDHPDWDCPAFRTAMTASAAA